jgi:hypothetical protein
MSAAALAGSELPDIALQTIIVDKSISGDRGRKLELGLPDECPVCPSKRLGSGHAGSPGSGQER